MLLDSQQCQQEVESLGLLIHTRWETQFTHNNNNIHYIKNNFLNEINTFIQQECITLIKCDRNGMWAANLRIRMISEGSCDTEDWSNDAENSAFHHSSDTQIWLARSTFQQFSSNPNQTHLCMLINVFRIFRKSQVGEFDQGWS